MRKKAAYRVLIVLVSLVAFCWLTTLPSVTRQAIDYRLQEIRIPFYLKTINFIDRHLNYRWTVQQIISNNMTDHQKAEDIFQWTIRHIAQQPKELPIIDDHVWHIIVRGYGVSDQTADVFATLSNYAGLKAMIVHLESSGSDVGRPTLVLGAVFFDGFWHICDPYRKTEFINNHGRWATTEELMHGEWRQRRSEITPNEGRRFDYREYFCSLWAVDLDKLYRGSRSSIQSPVRRLLHFFHG